MCKKDIVNDAIKAWGLEKSTEVERKNWGYKNKLNYSYKFLLGKTIKYGDDYFLIKALEFDRYKKMLLIINDDLKIKPTAAFLEIINPFSGNKTCFNLNPARHLKKLLTDGYLLDSKYFKKLYYSTEEYRTKYEKSLEENTGIKGIKSPIQSDKIKKKISSTMKTNHGVEWFLKRGSHYNLITNKIYEKYKDDEKKLFKVLGVSKIEIEIISILLSELNFSDDLYYFSKNKNQYYFKIGEEVKAVDFYDKTKNLIIEINGDFYHSNPKLYKPSDFNIYKNSSAEDLWNKEENILNEIKRNYGCKIFIIWVSEWELNKNEIIQKIKQLL